MRRLWSLAASIFCIAALPVAASAAGIIYDCDTAADHFSDLILPAPSPHFAVSGKIQLRASASSKKYLPAGRVQIASSTSPGQSPASYAGFSVVAVPAKKPTSEAPAMQMLSFDMVGKEDEVLPSSFAETGTPQDFTLSYDGNAVSVALGAEAKRFPIAVSEPVVRIVCSTGEFLITDLQIKAAN